MSVAESMKAGRRNLLNCAEWLLAAGFREITTGFTPPENTLTRKFALPSCGDTIDVSAFANHEPPYAVMYIVAGTARDEAGNERATRAAVIQAKDVFKLLDTVQLKARELLQRNGLNQTNAMELTNVYGALGTRGYFLHTTESGKPFEFGKAGNEMVVRVSRENNRTIVEEIKPDTETPDFRGNPTEWMGRIRERDKAP